MVDIYTNNNPTQAPDINLYIKEFMNITNETSSHDLVSDNEYYEI